MKKVFCIRDFNKASETSDCKPLIVAYKKGGELTLKNLCCNPSDRMKISIDPKTDEVVFRFRLHDNEFLGLGEAAGLEKTKVIKKGSTPQ